MMPDDDALPPAVRAFDQTAPRFDERFGEWRSVAAQRAAVRRYLLRTFPPGSRILELGAGTGDDALFLLERGLHVFPTDGSPAMVERATEKLRRAGYTNVPVEQVVLEELDRFERRRREERLAPFDGAFSNFAAFNCVPDLRRVARPLAGLIRPGGACVLVVFGGPCSIGEVIVELVRGRPVAAVRRFRRGPAPARIGQEHFQVWYPRPGAFARAFDPYFDLKRVRGIGITVPPSAAEPWISRFPRVVAAMEAADRLLSAPLARVADHVLLHLERTDVTAPPAVSPDTSI